MKLVLCFLNRMNSLSAKVEHISVMIYWEEGHPQEGSPCPRTRCCGYGHGATDYCMQTSDFKLPEGAIIILVRGAGVHSQFSGQVFG